MAIIVESCGDQRSDEAKWPPGFRFHPTDEELVLYYLKRKMSRKRLRPDIIRETDVYKWDPEDLPAQSILKTGDRQWFFFSPRDRKYPNGARSNRATGHGYWKATGKDRNMTCNSRNVGVKKTLVFYRGRAPSGERTDWVMHEYTMDEEELRRCPNIQDYYALYKVYKKSGPGPKNGEQYGAPFNEEDWVDDDVAVVNIPVMPEISVKPLNEAILADNIIVSGLPEPSVDDLDEILKQIVDEPALDQLQNNQYAYALDQVTGDEHTQSTLVDLSAKTVKEMTSSGLQYDLPACPAFNQSASSNIQSHEASEVTSTPNNLEPVIKFTDEDFLEMDDLIGPAPVLSTNVEQPVENFQFNNFDGLSELDLYHDAAMFWHDMGPADHETVSHSFANPFGDEVANQAGYELQQNSVNQVDYQFQQNSVTGQVDYQFQQHYMSNQADEHLEHNQLDNQVEFQCQNPSMVNVLDYQFQSNPVADPPFGAGHMSNQLWVQDQRTNVLTCPESNDEQGSKLSTGVVSGPVNSSTVVDANQSGKEGDSTNGGWFSSALWSFVESIPTSPASASENPLVNKAFQRMSSFSRMRMNAMNAHISNGNAAVNVRKVSRNRTFIFLSVFGGLCALLWVLIGAVKSVGDIKLLQNM